MKKEVKVTFRIEKSLRDKFMKAIKGSGLSQEWVINQMIKDYLSKPL